MKNLSSLQLELGSNELTNFSNLIISLSCLKKLELLKLDFSNNKIETLNKIYYIFT